MPGNGRIVVVAPNWLGDAVMALPAIADLRRHRPEAHLAVAARGGVAPLFTMVAGVDEVVTLQGKGGWRSLRSWRGDAAALGAGTFDTAVLLPNSFGSAWSASRASIAERWGFASDWRGRLLTRAVPRASGALHQAAYYQALMTGLGISSGPQHACVTVSDEAVGTALATAGLDPGAPFVVFAPGAAYGSAKQWLPERFAELGARVVRDLGWHVVLVGSRADASVCGEIVRRAGAISPRLGRHAPCRRGGRAGGGGVWRHQRAPHLSAHAGSRRPGARDPHARRLLPSLHAARVPHRPPLHARRHRRPRVRRPQAPSPPPPPRLRRDKQALSPKP